MYNFSEVAENKDDEEDLAIMSVFEKEATSPDRRETHQKSIIKPNPAVPPKPSTSKQRPASVKRPHQFNKLNESEKEKVFLSVYDENLKIKEYQRNQEMHYKQLEVKFKTMETQMKYLKGSMVTGKLEKGGDGDSELMQKYRFEKDQLNQENEKLRQKILALSNAHKIVTGNGPGKQPAKRRIVTPMTAQDQQQIEYKRSAAAGDGQVKDLLKLNDMLKKRCLEQESQIRSMQAMMNSKIVNNKELSDKNSTFVTLKERYEKMEAHLAAQRNQLDDERKRQSEIMQLLRDEREKNYTLEQQVRSMELMTKSAQDLGADLMECKRQKSELEEKLKILMESPFFKDYNERASVAAKMKGMEAENIRNTTDLRNLRDLNARLETENAIRKQELTEAQTELKKKYEECKEYQMQLHERDKQLAPFKDLAYWDNDQFLKVLGNLKWTGEDPAWRKIEFIDRTYLDSDDPNVLRKEIEHLKLEKGELAAHLEKTQTLLKTRQDIEGEKDRLHKLEIDKLTLQLKAATAKCSELAKIADLRSQVKQAHTLYEAEGVKYDDTVSVFEVDPSEEDQLQPGENFFDFFVGDTQLDSTGVVQSYQREHPGGQIDPTSILTFLTIDFFDHETQHTSVSEGLNCAFNLQVSFKVQADGPFIQYLESGYLKVELYMSQGSDAIKLATGLLSLRELVLGNRQEGVSKVISGHITLNGYNNQFVGIAMFKGRMRQPISQIIKWLKDQRELDIQDEDETTNIVAVRKRKLVVVIDKATQLNPRSNSFIYYSLDNKDYNTNTQPGATPRWDYRMVHEIIYNEEFVNYLKRQPLEFYLIDDNQPLTSELQSDKIGMCSLDVSSLISGEIVDLAAEIKNDDGERVGALYVKVFWYESRDEDPLQKQGTGLIQQSWEEQFTNKIAAEARSRGLTSRQTFRVLDFDDDKVISFEDFQNGLKNILGIKVNQQEANLYYMKLPQPLNQQSFDSIFRNLIGQGIEDSMYQTGMGGQSDLSQINKMVSFNTQQLQMTQERVEVVRRSINDIFQERMRKGKSRSDLFNEIDSIKPDGFISVSELWGWLRYQGLKLSEEEVGQFLSTFMDQDQDNQVNTKEFFNYILGGLKDGKPATSAQGSMRYQTFMGRQMNPDQYDLIQRALDTILQYAKQNKYTLMKVREIMDQNRNGSIERQELGRFLEGCGFSYTQQELSKIVDFFDVNKDGLISIQEFADALSLHNASKRTLQRQPTFTGVNEYVVGYLISYMKKANRSMAQIFNEIDLNGDGYLSRAEMKDIFHKKIIVPLDGDEFETFFKHFDENNDDRISIKEFVSVIQPAMQQVGGSSVTPQGKGKSTNDRLQYNMLMKKCEEILTKNHRIVLQTLETREDPNNPMFISPQNFKIVLQSLNIGFMPADIDRIIDEVVEKNKAGLIDYVKFIDIGRPKKRESIVTFDQTSVSGFGSMSQLDQQKAVSKAQEVFAKISRNIKRMNISKDAVFKTFDLDGDNKIQKEEMREVFEKMKLKVTPTELDMIFATLDAQNAGFINVQEFLKWVSI